MHRESIRFPSLLPQHHGSAATMVWWRCSDVLDDGVEVGGIPSHGDELWVQSSVALARRFERSLLPPHWQTWAPAAGTSGVGSACCPGLDESCCVALAAESFSASGIVRYRVGLVAGRVVLCRAVPLHRLQGLAWVRFLRLSRHVLVLLH